jgi:LCP family protein required for cell wall assembly
MKKKSVVTKFLSRRILLLIQLIISIVFLGYIYYLKMLPMKYYLILVGIIALLWFFMSFFIKYGIKKKKKENKYGMLIFSKLLSLVLSISLIIVSVMAFKGNSFLSNITGSLTQTRVISLYVKKESKYKKLSDIQKDLKKMKVGIASEKGTKNINTAIAEMEDATGEEFKIKDYKDYSALGDAIDAGKIDVAVVDNSYSALLEANHEGMDDGLRSLYQVEIEEQVQSVTQKTDVTEKPFIVYLTGIDTYGTVSAISRADVNLAVCVSPKQKQILMISIPRDTQVNLHRNGKMDKLTHSAMYGIDETISTIEDFLELKVNYYAKTNFSGITNIIDALGGVTIDSPYSFKTLHGNYKIVKGKNEMDGNKALCFVRERHALPNGDFDRGRNQQRLLKAMISKAISPKIITNYSQILQAVEGCFETNMTSDEIKSLVYMQLDDMAKWETFNVQLSGDPEISYKTYSMKGKKCYTMVPSKKSLNSIIKIINKVENGERIKEKDIKGLQGA